MSQSRYSQKGGANNMPYRFFNANATPFKSCSGCGQKGGSVGLPYRYFNPKATPFKPCASCGQKYYNDFNDAKSKGCQGYNSCNMTGGAKRQAQKQTQCGGFPTGAPMTHFTNGKPLKYNYSLNDGDTPVFDHVGHNNFW